MGAGGQAVVEAEVATGTPDRFFVPCTAESGDANSLQDAWELLVAERLRATYQDADKAFATLQGSQVFRKKLQDIKDFVPPLALEDEVRNKVLFQAYIEGMRHFQNPHLGPPGMDVGVSEASLGISLVQRPDLRLYVAGLVHHGADRITAEALHRGLVKLFEGTGVDCALESVKMAIRRFDSSTLLCCDGTLFIDDFARFFKHGKYPADTPTSERLSLRPVDGVSCSASSSIKYNQYKSLSHAKKSIINVDLKASAAARKRRLDRMTYTLSQRLKEELGYYSAACDRLTYPGHGGEKDRKDVRFKVSASILPSGANVSLKLDVKAEPGAGPALALAALDPSLSGLLSIEHLRLGLEQCNLGLTIAELHMAAAAYCVLRPDGLRVRWVQLLHDMGGLPPSILEHMESYDETAVMLALHEELLYWEAAARTALEGSEQRFTAPDELASQLVFSPVGTRQVNRNSVKLFCFVDNPSLADTVHIHTNLIAEPPVHIFFSTMITPSGEDVVRIKLTPSENKPTEPPPTAHPILDAPLVVALTDQCVAMWSRLLGMAASYASAVNAAAAPKYVTKGDFKYAMMSVFKKSEILLTDRQIDTLMAAYPGPELKDAASRVTVGRTTLCVPDLLLELCPSLADLTAEKEQLGIVICGQEGDQSDLQSARCTLAMMVFSGYARLRAELLAAADALGGVTTSTLAAAINTCLGLDTSKEELDWALRFLHAPSCATVDGAALMNVVSATMAAEISKRCTKRMSSH